MSKFGVCRPLSRVRATGKLFPMMAKRRSPRTTASSAGALAQAFTLVELLAVAAIVAVVLVLVLPVLGGMQSKAKEAESISNLRSMGVAIQSYQAEHDMDLPGPCTVSIYSEVLRIPAKTWTLSWYLQDYLAHRAHESNPDKIVIDSIINPLTSSLRDNNGARVPGYQVYGGVKTDFEGNDYYAVNRNVGHRFGYSQWNGMILRPPQKILSLDDVNRACGWITEMHPEPGHTFHKGRRAWLFPDGSVEMRPLDQWPAFRIRQEEYSELADN